MAYAGRWYEVASLKKGFAGEGQADCHCTQGIYTPKQSEEGEIRLQVDTFCLHGGPSGRLSGIQARMRRAACNPRMQHLVLGAGECGRIVPAVLSQL